MKKRLMYSIVALIVLVAGIAYGQDKTPPQGKPVQIRGLVRDIACPMQNKESTAAHFNKDCALACARAGSPLIILTNDGTMYMPITDTMPDVDQRSRLMPFVAKYVVATGTIYERNGVHAIALQSIQEDQNAHVPTDAVHPK
jgi:hypothetical protein